MSTPSPLASARRSTELGLVVMAGAHHRRRLHARRRSARTPRSRRSSCRSSSSLLGLLVVAHVATRLLARGADGTLLPLAVLLNGIGYVMIARLDDRLAGLQTTWTFIAIVAFVAHAARRAAHHRPRPLQVDVPRSSAPACCCCRWCPASGRSVGGARIWVSIGPINFQPGEFAKICLALFFAGYLADNRELIAAGTWRVGPLRLPEPRYLLPITLAWGVRGRGDGGREGPRLVAAVLHPVHRDAVGRHRARQLPRPRHWSCSPAPPTWRGDCSATCRPASTSGSTRGPQYEGKGYQIVQAMFAFANGGIGGTGLGLGSPNKIPAVKTDFIFAAIGEELGLFGATAVLHRVPAHDRRRPAHRHPRRAPVREAARHRPHHDHRHAGVHHHRRRHPGGAAHRHHAAVRELRRLAACWPTTCCSRCSCASATRAPAGSARCPTTLTIGERCEARTAPRRERATRSGAEAAR